MREIFLSKNIYSLKSEVIPQPNYTSQGWKMGDINESTPYMYQSKVADVEPLMT